MLISKIIDSIEQVSSNYEIINEREFSTLSLIGQYNKSEYLTFIDSEKFIDLIDENVSMLLTSKEISAKIKNSNIGLIITDEPRNDYFRIHNFLSLNDKYDYKIKKKKTEIGKNCTISKMASIADNNVFIGDNVLIEEFVVIRENTTIGDNSIIRSGAKIGSVGFEFKNTKDGIMAVEHAGSVRIGNNVEIQYNTAIDRAVYPHDETYIGDYTKVDNLVHIAHGVKVSEKTMIVALSGIGGRVVVGENSWIGFGSTIRNGINIKDNARVNMGAVVTRDVESHQAVTGNFAIEHSKFLEQLKKI